MGFLALLCAIIGVAVAAFNGTFVMPPLQWFVLGILFAVLAGAEPWAVPWRRVQ